MGRAIAERFRSDNAPILQPQSDARERNVYVFFVFFVAKQQTDPPSPTTYAKATVVKRLRRTGRKQKMKLQEAIKGMGVKSWERRENSSGKCTVYVRFAPKEPTLTVNVKGE